MSSEISKQEGKSEEEITLQQLRRFIKSEVENEERIQLATASYSTPEKKVGPRFSKNQNKSNTPTASSLLSTKDREEICIFCSGSHKSCNCFKAKTMNVEEKRKI